MENSRIFFDYIVVGCGGIGSATVYWLSKRAGTGKTFVFLNNYLPIQMCTCIYFLFIHDCVLSYYRQLIIDFRLFPSMIK